MRKSSSAEKNPQKEFRETIAYTESIGTTREALMIAMDLWTFGRTLEVMCVTRAGLDPWSAKVAKVYGRCGPAVFKNVPLVPSRVTLHHALPFGFNEVTRAACVLEAVATKAAKAGEEGKQKTKMMLTHFLGASNKEVKKFKEHSAGKHLAILAAEVALDGACSKPMLLDLAEKAGHLAEKLRVEGKSRARRDFKEWTGKACDKGASQAHSFTTKPVKETFRELSERSDQQEANREADNWGDLWGRSGKKV